MYCLARIPEVDGKETGALAVRLATYSKTQIHIPAQMMHGYYTIALIARG